jgi:glucose-1-phosphate adenylyltransferase
MNDTAVMIMAGGRGSRLGPLTVHRSKPAVPFAGRYRIIDFVLSNFVNSGYRRIYVLTQYMASSLIRHLNRAWRLHGFGEFVEVVPAQMRTGEFWYRGTADAVFQNLNLIRDESKTHSAIFGGDHVYMFAVNEMDAAHRARNADLTVAAFPVPRSEAHQFGIIDVDAEGRIIGFIEKPANPPAMPGRPDWSLVSMGNYIFRSRVLQETLVADAADPSSSHDFGRDIIPRLVREGARAYIYDFAQNPIPGEQKDHQPYWRDVGTVDSYFDSNMELRSAKPPLNLYNRSWRIHTAQREFPPVRLLRHFPDGQESSVIDSMVCEGSIVSSARLHRALIGYDCFVHAGSEVDSSIILSGCDIGANSRLHRVLMDKNCKVDRGTVVGENQDHDRARFPFVTDSGIVLLPKGTHVPREGPIHLAADVDTLLRSDPDFWPILRDGSYAVSAHPRHSFMSAGPRYLRYGPSSDDPNATGDMAVITDE